MEKGQPGFERAAAGENAHQPVRAPEGVVHEAWPTGCEPPGWCVGFHQVHVDENLLEVRLSLEDPVGGFRRRICDGPAQVAVPPISRFWDEKAANFQLPDVEAQGGRAVVAAADLTSQGYSLGRLHNRRRMVI